MSFIENGEVVLNFRTKINNVNDAVRITVTDELIAAGTITSIPVTVSTKAFKIYSGQHVYIVDLLSGVVNEVTLAADWTANSDTAMTISSYVLADDITSGSFIYLPMIEILTVTQPIPL